MVSPIWAFMSPLIKWERPSPAANVCPRFWTLKSRGGTKDFQTWLGSVCNPNGNVTDSTDVRGGWREPDGDLCFSPFHFHFDLDAIPWGSGRRYLASRAKGLVFKPPAPINGSLEWIKPNLLRAVKGAFHYVRLKRGTWRRSFRTSQPCQQGDY